MILRVATRALVGMAASLVASAIVVSAKAASSTHCQIRPKACARSAGSLSPVSARPRAVARPTRRGSNQVPPPSGTKPILEKAWMKLAERAAITTSQPSAIFAPAPAATPLTMAITGTGMLRMRSANGL